jgi:ribokinase
MMLNARGPIVVVGSINTDLVVTAGRLPGRGETITGGSFRTYQGGKGANQAVAAARLGYPVKMIGKVGRDDFGRESLAGLRGNGVEVADVEIQEGESGVAVITVGAQGENSIVVVPGANAAVTPEFVESKRGVLRNAGMVLAQLEIPVETIVRLAEICEEEGVPLMLDPAPARELPKGLLRRCAWVTPNETEAMSYIREPQTKEPRAVAEELLSQGMEGVVLKRGEKGTYIALRDGSRYAVPAFAVNAVDSVAAGDTFNGAFAVGLLSGRDLIESARYASAAAAISVTRAGAQASMPRASEVDEFLANVRPGDSSLR